MKSGGWWNLKGLRPRPRDPAPRSGNSVGEWLNNVVHRTDEPDLIDNERLARRLDTASRNARDRGGNEPAPARQRSVPPLSAEPGEFDAPQRDPADDQPPTDRARAQFGDVHARLNTLSQELQRLGRAEAVRHQAARPPAAEPSPERPPAPAPPPRRRQPAQPSLSIEDAVVEIAARQRALDRETEIAAPAPVALPPATPAPAIDFSGLERQLREITARIEALQPANNIEKAIADVRTDLAEIGRQLSEALPRRAIESLETEVKALAERIDNSRQTGADGAALAGLERGLADVCEALRRLTPAENLVGFDAAVHALVQKADQILARDDPGAVQQLEAAIDDLRGVVSRVASNDTLAKVAEDMRVLSAQVDALANRAATGEAVSALEQRIETLAAALSTSSEAGQSVPRDLETLLAGLIEKLEWVQLTHTDHAALAHLEDRIAALVQRFDASDARLGHLEAIERGLADLLVHIEQMRGTSGALASGTAAAAPEASIERNIAEIKENDRRTQDMLEAVQGTVEHVVDRLASIESSLYHDTPSGPGRLPSSVPPRSTEPGSGPPGVSPALPDDSRSPGPSETSALPPAEPSEFVHEQPVPRAASARTPIDPDLPPDHPLEPGSAIGRSRPTLSAAERVAASEAALGANRPPVIADAGRTDFIAAARRAAQAAASEQARSKGSAEETAPESGAQPNKLSERLRKLIAAGGAVIILVAGVHVGLRMFAGDGSSPSAPPAHPTRVSVHPKARAAEAASTQPQTAGPPLSILPAGPAPGTVPARVKAMKPDRQSSAHADARPATGATTTMADQTGSDGLPSWVSPDVTGALPSSQPMGRIGTPLGGTAAANSALPAAIGDSALRAAATAGNPAAAYEIASRFADGRGIAQNFEQAAYWLQRAAKQGLAPAEFRLGGFYEKGIGVEKDIGKARDLYLAAAQKGNGRAMHNLAVLFAEGINGPPDYEKAALWFRKAAEHGIEDSQYNLGILYARGIGVPQSDEESYKWFALAASQGDQDAAKKRDEIAAHLDSQSLTAARAAVRSWKPEPQPEDAISVKTVAAWNLPAELSGTASAH